MADLLTERLTCSGGRDGRALQDPTRWDSPPSAPVPEVGGASGHGAPAGVRLEVQLVMTDGALLGSDDRPAEVVGYGPVPASVARRMVRDAPDDARVWVRRLFTDPVTGGLAAMESRARHFPPSLRRFLVLRDEVCRTPWCNAPIRHADHVVAHAAGGATSAENGQGLCVTCNQVKESRGWSAAVGRDGTVSTSTPTGHRWDSAPPDRWRPAHGLSADGAYVVHGDPKDAEARRGPGRAPLTATGPGSPGERHLQVLLSAA